MIVLILWMRKQTQSQIARTRYYSQQGAELRLDPGFVAMPLPGHPTLPLCMCHFHPHLHVFVHASAPFIQVPHSSSLDQILLPLSSVIPCTTHLAFCLGLLFFKIFLISLYNDKTLNESLYSFSTQINAAYLVSCQNIC